MHRPFLRLTLLLTFALAAGTVRADLSFFGPAPPPPTLAQALAALEAPKQDLFLTVGADRITLPPGDPPPDPDSRPGQVGTAYGRLIRDFGGVMALAPPTMVVLNTRPGVPDPYDGLPVEDALQLLLAGLTPSQWTALTGPSGLGAADLSDDAQRGLFLALLPNGTVTVRPQVSAQFSGPVPAGPAPQPISVTVPTLRAARLHLNRWTSLISVAEGKPNQGVIGSFSPFEGKVRYETSALLDPFPPPQETAAGAVLRQVLPNNPKDADLDYDAAPLKRSVRLEGIATVGDLVARVGQSAGLELYADPRYAGRQVTLVGRRTARGVDLLRAAAFCVMGTFRRVGPAYVLTDDLQGTALRRARLGRFMGEAAMTRHAAVEAAGDSLMTAHGGLDALPPLDDRGMSSAQAALPKQEVGSAWGGVQVTFTQLTPAQQDYATALMRQANAAADQAEAAGGGRGPRWTPGGTFVLSAQPALFWQSPAVPGPFLLSAEGLNADSLYQISLTRRKEIDRLGIKDDPATCRPPPPPPVPPTPPSLLAALMAPLPRRAVLAAPRTAREVDRVVAQMKNLGLNQLWLDVFSGGHSRLDKPGGGGPDILTEALARTKGTGIVVIPTLDLLLWGADAPAEARDLTASGETSDKAQAWAQHYETIVLDQTADTLPPSGETWVSPAAPVTEKTLLTLVRRLSAMPGVTTLALRDTVPPGYYHLPPPNAGDSGDALGYTPALRLALLRRAHADPWDLDRDFGGTVDLSLPEFGDGDAIQSALKDWNALRDGVSRDLLRRLLAAAQDTSGRRFRFLVPSRGALGAQAWYGLWDDPQAPLPEVPSVLPKQDAGVLPWEVNYAPLAHAQCRVNLDALPAVSFWSPFALAGALRVLKPGWDGVVLDMTGPGGGDRLAALARGSALKADDRP